jgi:hypothetical protein
MAFVAVIQTLFGDDWTAISREYLDWPDKPPN